MVSSNSKSSLLVPAPPGGGGRGLTVGNHDSQWLSASPRATPLAPALRRAVLILILSLVLSGILGCEAPPEYPELEKAIRVVRYLSAPNQLQRSSFLVVFPGGQPSNFVTWMFSTFGTAEWPPAEGSLEMEGPDWEDALRATGTPIRPREVSLVPLKPDPELKKQIVVKADDVRKKILVAGYLEPGTAPVLVREWDWAPAKSP